MVEDTSDDKHKGTRMIMVSCVHTFYVLPFISISVSLYMDFLNSSGLEVCRIVNKVCEPENWFSYQTGYGMNELKD